MFEEINNLPGPKTANHHFDKFFPPISYAVTSKQCTKNTVDDEVEIEIQDHTNRCNTWFISVHRPAGCRQEVSSQETGLFQGSSCTGGPTQEILSSDGSRGSAC